MSRISLSQKEFDELSAKAKKYESLEKEISKFYCNAEGEIDNDNPERKGDLTDIGEVAARATGWL